ncbi:MAG TPA: folylpolyglutamate synthase/dihydrofolate synthase family protein [Microbacteriaceae bacterium]|nr:folylpolyglutamate synthase/dihydrofolate synthase family protein [Microbacteriaceae bacterium]
MSELVYRELLERVGEQAPRPRLEPSARLVDLLGSPQRSAPVVHVTGTNGKTSTSRMIEALLRSSGLRTGLLTSPHLERFAERIIIDGEPIDDEALERNWLDIRPFVEMVDAELGAAGEAPLTFFETLTALAFACFADAPVDVMVIEVGMGGEWDSTNVADGDVAVFTPVDLDHLGRIGDSLEEIATTKAGIIKPGALVVSASQAASVESILRERASERGAQIRFAGEAFALDSTTPAVGGQLVSIRGLAGRYAELFVPMYGAHQGQNAALALAAVEAFVGGGTVELDSEVVTSALAEVTSPGRLEIIGVAPTVILDGAHNPHGARALVRAIEESFQFDELAVVVGVLAEKDADGLVAALAPLGQLWFATQSRSDRALPAEDVGRLAVRHGRTATVEPDADAAIRAARDWAGQAAGRGVLVTGSLTLVGHARAFARSEGWLHA